MWEERFYKLIESALRLVPHAFLIGAFYLALTIPGAPHEPNAATGQVVASSSHGKFVYLTSFQNLVQCGLFPALFTIMVFAAVIEKLKKRHRSPNEK